MIYYTCVIKDKVEKTGLVYSSIPTGCGAGISGLDETKVKYEEVNGFKNEHVCNVCLCMQNDSIFSKI